MATPRPILRYAVLLWLLAALALLNWKLMNMAIDISPVSAERESSSTTTGDGTAAPPVATVRPLPDLKETLARPLFHPTRRPVEPAPAAEPEAEPPAQPPPPPETRAVAPSRLSLVGVMGTGGRAKRALLRAEGQPHGTWVELGGEIDGWRIARIEDSRVVIEKEGGREELALKR